MIMEVYSFNIAHTQPKGGRYGGKWITTKTNECVLKPFSARDAPLVPQHPQGGKVGKGEVKKGGGEPEDYKSAPNFHFAPITMIKKCALTLVKTAKSYCLRPKTQNKEGIIREWWKKKGKKKGDVNGISSQNSTSIVIGRGGGDSALEHGWGKER